MTKFTPQQLGFAAYLRGRFILLEDGLKILGEKYSIDEAAAKRLWRVGRKILKRWVKQSKDEHFLESAAFYRSALQMPNVRMQDKLQARQRLDELLQLEEAKNEDEDIPGLSDEETADAIAHITERARCGFDRNGHA